MKGIGVVVVGGGVTGPISSFFFFKGKRKKTLKPPLPSPDSCFRHVPSPSPWHLGGTSWEGSPGHVRAPISPSLGEEAVTDPIPRPHRTDTPPSPPSWMFHTHQVMGSTQQLWLNRQAPLPCSENSPENSCTVSLSIIKGVCGVCMYVRVCDL